MMYRIALVILFSTCSFLAADESNLKECLPLASEEKDPNTTSYLRVRILLGIDETRLPKDIVTGDRVVGVDGFRIGSNCEYNFVKWQKVKENAPLRLRIIRDGKFMDVTCVRDKPIRNLGVMLFPPHLPWKMFERLGVDVKKIFKKKTGRHMTMSDLSMVQLMPGLICREFERMISGNVDQKRWAMNFLDVYFDLCLEKFDDASEGVRGLLNPPKGVHPLMVKVVKFYSKVAKKQPNARQFPLDFYGVTKEFAALYYPYPILRVSKLGKVFSTIPKLQKLIETKLNAPAADVRRVKADTSWVRTLAVPKNPPPSFMTEFYVDRIKLSYLDEFNHGGWPYKFSGVLSSKYRRGMLKQLRKRYDEKPDDRFATSVALVMAGLFEGSFKDVRKGQAYIATLGSREMAMLDETVHRAALSEYVPEVRRDPFLKTWQRYVDIQSEAIEAKGELPGIYQYIYQHSPAFHSKGLADFTVTALYGFVGHYSQKPWMVAPALVEKRNIDDIDALVRKGVKSKDAKTVEQALWYATYTLEGGCCRKGDVDNYVNLAKKVPIVTFYRSIIHLVTTYCMNNIRRPFEFYKVLGPMSDLQQADVALQWQEIQSWDNASPQLIKQASEFFEKNGSPLVSLMLFEKLYGAGKLEEAGRYRGMAANYYLGIMKVFGDKRNDFWYNVYFNYKLAPDLCAVKGCESWIESFFVPKRLGGEPFASTASMYAYALANQGKWNAAIDQLERAFGMSTMEIRVLPKHQHKKRGHTIWYQGTPLSSNTYDFPKALSKSWLESKAVSAAQKKRIRSIVKNWRDLQAKGPIEAQCNTMHAVPCKKPIVVDGRLNEWDMSGKRTLSPDIRYKGVCSSDVALCYDKKGLYLGIHFNDVSPMDSACYPLPPECGRYTDSAVICFRIGDKSTSILAWHSWKASTPVVYYVLADSPQFPLKGKFKRGYTNRTGFGGFKLAFDEDRDGRGYGQELFIPWDKISDGPSIPKKAIKMAVELNWGCGFCIWCMVGNVRDGTVQNNKTLENSDNYGNVVLSPKGDLKLPLQIWQELLGINNLDAFVSLEVPAKKRSGLSFLKGARGLAMARRDGAVEFWDFAKNGVSETLKTNHKKLLGLCYDSQGDVLATSGGDGMIDVWKGKKLVQSLKGHSKAIWGMDLSPKGDKLISSSNDKSLVIWDVGSGAPIKRLSLKNSARVVRFSPDGKRIALGDLGGNVCVYDAKTRESTFESKGHDFSVTALCFSKDGKTLFSGGSDMGIIEWNVVTGKKIKRYSGHAAQVSNLVECDNGDLLSASLDGSIRRWNVKSGEASIVFKGDSGIQCLAYDSKSEAIVFTTVDGGVFSARLKKR